MAHMCTDSRATAWCGTDFRSRRLVDTGLVTNLASDVAYVAWVRTHTRDGVVRDNVSSGTRKTFTMAMGGVAR